MEPLHSMNTDEAVAFLRKFFARHEGKYDLSVAGEAASLAEVKS